MAAWDVMGEVSFASGGGLSFVANCRVRLQSAMNRGPIALHARSVSELRCGSRAVLLTHLPSPQIRVRNTLNFGRPAKEGGQSSYVPATDVRGRSKVRRRKPNLLDHLIGSKQERLRNSKVECLGRLEVDE